MAKEIRTPQDIVQKVGVREYFQGIVGGNINTRAKLTEEEIDAALSQIKRIQGSQETGNIIDDGGQVYVIELHRTVDSKTIKYITLMQHGKVIGDAEDLDRGMLEINGLLGANSLEQIIKNSFENTPLPSVLPIKKLKKDEKKMSPLEMDDSSVIPKDTADRKPRIHPEIIIHPDFVKYLHEHQGYLSAQTSGLFEEPSQDSESNKKPKVIKSLNDLKNIGVPESYIRRAREEGFNIFAQPSNEFVKHDLRKAISTRKGWLDTVLSRDDVNHLLSGYTDTISGGENIAQAHAKHFSLSRNMRLAYEYLKNRTIVRDLDVPTLFDALRHRELGLASGNDVVYLTLREGLGRWITLAKAADVIKQDPNIRKAVDIFKTAKTDEKKRVSERVYDGMMALTKAMVDPQYKFSPDEVEFIIGGLWIEGLLPKNLRYEGTTESKEVDREIRGVMDAYGIPIKHLMARWGRFNDIVIPSFKKQLTAGYIHVKSLESGVSDHELSLNILHNLKDEEYNPLFQRLYKCVPLVRPGEVMGNNTSERVLQYFIGVNRDLFSSLLRENRSIGD